jgi:acyl carrier protein
MPNNKVKLIKLFQTSLNISENAVNQNLKYNEIEEWDSIGHMTLMSAIEDEFKISLETDDIIDFSSFKKGIEILEKYKVRFDA